MQLTTDQQTLEYEFVKFLLDPTRKQFIIDGRPGCGKTTMIPHLIQKAYDIKNMLASLMDINNDLHIQLTATTNKAVEALQNRFTDREVRTIHSFLNLRVFDDYTTGKTKLTKTNNYVVHSNVLLFVDEMSMADTELLWEINKATINSKVVFILDKNQVLPVFENHVPLLKDREPDVTLKEIVRQQTTASNTNPIKDLVLAYTDAVENKTMLPPIIADGVSIIQCSKQEFKAAIDAHFTSPDAEHKYRILTFTNKKTNQYNSYVRSLLGKTEMLQAGEWLIANEAFAQNGEPVVSNQQEVLVTNASALLQDPDTGIYYQELVLKIKNRTIKVNYAIEPKHLNDWINYYKKLKDWQKMFALKNAFIDLRSPYSSTVHKAQGSTFEAVFLDIPDICSNNKIEEVRRLMLVGISRPTIKLFVYGEIPPKYRL